MPSRAVLLPLWAPCLPPPPPRCGGGGGMAVAARSLGPPGGSLRPGTPDQLPSGLTPPFPPLPSSVALAVALAVAVALGAPVAPAAPSRRPPRGGGGASLGGRGGWSFSPPPSRRRLRASWLPSVLSSLSSMLSLTSTSSSHAPTAAAARVCLPVGAGGRQHCRLASGPPWLARGRGLQRPFPGGSAGSEFGWIRVA